MKVITLCNKDYFKFGKLFLETRKNVDADFIMYGSNLTKDQKAQLKHHSIAHVNVPASEFETKMQFLKFKMLMEHPGETRTLVDFDTLFLKDWPEVFETQFDLGITVRNEVIKAGRQPRGYSNGGVIFCGREKSADDICAFALKVMEKGKHKLLPEYDQIFKFGLEENRPKHKTWKRENLRWWCDQVFLSSLVQRYFNVRGKRKTIKGHVFYDFGSYRIGLFSCSKYNLIDPNSGHVRKGKACILHLKTQGRNNKRVKGIHNALRSISKEKK